jgi:hypothetical protein
VSGTTEAVLIKFLGAMGSHTARDVCRHVKCPKLLSASNRSNAGPSLLLLRGDGFLDIDSNIAVDRVR